MPKNRTAETNACSEVQGLGPLLYLARFGVAAKHLRDWSLYQLAAEVAQKQAQSNRVI